MAGPRSTITLPASRATAPAERASAGTPAKAAVAESTERKLRVLVMDDEEPIRNLIHTA